VDPSDFRELQSCFNGPNCPPTLACNTVAEFDEDADADLGDFNTFRACPNGPSRPPGC
jgi:hypothetical protein